MYAGEVALLPAEIKGALDAQYYISVYKSISGWKACMYGPEGPEQTGVGSWSTKAEAVVEAEEWARDAGVPYIEWECDGS